MRIYQASLQVDACACPLHPVVAATAPTEFVRTGNPGDENWLAEHGGFTVAQASLWWRNVPSLPGQVLGLIGHYAAANAEAGAGLLARLTAELAGHGCTTAVGPIDGSTWRAYRAVTERGPLPPFFLEPNTPDDWPEHFAAAGFSVLATYTSSLVDPVPPPSPRVEETGRRLAASGYTVRPLDLTRAAAELDALYDVSVAAFAQNYLYTPTTRAEFHAQYSAILPYVDPRLVLLAEHNGRVAGYVFAVPDVLEVKRTGRTMTSIVKTLAIDPAHAGAGLGGLLVERVQLAGSALGLTRVIHALMHETNVSQRISKHYGTTCRRYALFARPT